MRPAPSGEETESPVPKLGKDNKRKRASKPDDPQDKRDPARRQRRKLIQVDMDSIHQLNDGEEDKGEESALVTRARKPVEVVMPSKSETLSHCEEAPKKSIGKDPESPEFEIVPLPPTSTPKGRSTEIPRFKHSALSDILRALTIGHYPPLPTYSEEAIREAQDLQMPDPSRVPGEEDPFKDYFTRVDEAADLNDASILFEKAHHFFSRAITRFKAELKKSSDKGKALRLLCSQKEEELKDLRADLAKARQNEVGLDKQVTIILQGYGLLDLTVEANTLVSQLQQKLDMIGQIQGEVDQAKKIDELEAKLAAIGAEVAETRFEIEKVKATTDKTVAVYLKDADAAQMELREASNKEKRISDLAKCQSRRETLEEIHARGFDLTEEIAQAKPLEADAKFLVSSFSSDDDAEGSQSGFNNEAGPEEEAAPEGETSPGYKYDLPFFLYCCSL
ncbi:uncharacterized protein [Nicotiana sylvestris]|uniref:uncharacterized protein n=1 Tax=Nicotiana sylvestris TaxID=4096 RepID=UPI00388CDCC7